VPKLSVNQFHAGIQNGRLKNLSAALCMMSILAKMFERSIASRQTYLPGGPDLCSRLFVIVQKY